MRFVVFKSKADNKPVSVRPGLLSLDGNKIVDLTAVLDLDENRFKNLSSLNEWFDLDGELYEKAKNIWRQFNDGATFENAVIDAADAELSAPVPKPGKLICIGLNYRDHAIESNMAIPEKPIVFSKFPSSVIGSGENVVLPENSQQADYEAELAVIIGRTAKNVSAQNAMDHVFGYTNLNDVSEREYQFADGQWQRGKSCDTFAPMGPFAATADEISDPHSLSVKLRLNGELMQDSTTAQFIFDIPAVIEFLTQTITLEPGDVIATGTPPGVGFARKPPVYIKAGDVMEVEVEGLGILTNAVV